MNLTNKGIFIVEDDAGGLAIASHYLREQRALVFFARWGDRLVADIKRSLPIDVILMDLMYPSKVTGFDLFQELQKDPELAKIPVIAVSSMDPDIAMPRAKQLGFAGFIAKPVSPAIVKYVTSVLEGNQVWIGVSR